MPNLNPSSEQQIRELAQTACDRHPYGFNIDLVEADQATQQPSFAVTVSQPDKPASVGDKEWWDAITAIRNEIQEIPGVSRVYVIYADKSP